MRFYVKFSSLMYTLILARQNTCSSRFWHGSPFELFHIPHTSSNPPTPDQGDPGEVLVCFMDVAASITYSLLRWGMPSWAAYSLMFERSIQFSHSWFRI